VAGCEGIGGDAGVSVSREPASDSAWNEANKDRLLFSASTVVVSSISTQFSSTPAQFRNEKSGLPIV
jgi:hypothetical protein